MTRGKIFTISIGIILGFCITFNINYNPYWNNFLSLSFEVTEQKDEGIFSSLSRNFEKTIEEINNDEGSSNTPNDNNNDEGSSNTPNDNNNDENSTRLSVSALDSPDVLNSNSSSFDNQQDKNQSLLGN